MHAVAEPIIEKKILKSYDFHKYIIENKSPDSVLEMFEKTANDIAREQDLFWNKIDNDLFNCFENIEKHFDYKIAKDDIKAIKERIINEMDLNKMSYKELQKSNIKVVLDFKYRERFNLKQFKKDNPEIYKKYIITENKPLLLFEN